MAKVILQDLTIYNCGSHEQLSDLKIKNTCFCLINKLTCFECHIFIRALPKADEKTGLLHNNIVFIQNYLSLRQ